MKPNNTYTKNQLEEIWNLVPINYYEDGESRNMGQRLWHSHKRRIFRKLFKDIRKDTSGKIKILDVGCADGHLTQWLKTEWPNAEVYGIDVVPKLVKAAEKKYPKCAFKVGDAHEIPFKAGTFDLVLCSEVLEHVIDPLKVCQEIKRVLKKNGHTILELDTGSPLFAFLWFFWIRFGAGRVWRDAHLHQFDSSTLPETIRKAKMNIVKQLHHHVGMATSVLAKK